MSPSLTWDHHETLVHRYHRRACSHGGRSAISFLELDGRNIELSWFELDRRARSVAASLQAMGAADKRVVLLVPAGLDYVVGFLGCLYARAVAVPAYPPHGKRGLAQAMAITANAQAAFGITTRQFLAESPVPPHAMPAAQAVYWLCIEDLAAGYADEWQEPVICDDTLALLQYTSGSTTDSRGVMVTHGNLRHNFRMLSELLGYGDETRMLVWLPLYHDMGLIGGTLSVLYSGGTVALMAPETFLQRPLRWLRAISERRANTTGAPNFAYDLCVRKASPEDLDGLDLRSLNLVFVGAEPVWANTLERFANTFRPCGFNAQMWYPCYGLAEATLIVTGCARSTPPVTCHVDRAAIERNVVELLDEPAPDALTLVGCGHPPEGLDVRIVDPDTRAVCPPDRVGEIWVAGPSVAKGYWNNPEATEAAFHARIARTDEGPFLRTGDLGFFHEGLLHIAGRLKDLIIINGRNHHPHDIEATAMHAHPLIRPGGCAAFSVPHEPEERLVLVIEVRRDTVPAKKTQGDSGGVVGGSPIGLGAVVDAVRRAVGTGHDLLVHRVALVGSGSVPKTSSGKTQRRKCRESYLNGSLGVIFEG